MACRSGCPTPGRHQSWGECLRDADIQIDRHSLKHGSVEKDKDRRLSQYESLRSQGIQPKSTTWRDVREASETGGTKPTEVVTTDAD